MEALIYIHLLLIGWRQIWMQEKGQGLN